MASERQNMSEQDISIKQREHELYVKPVSATTGKPVKPFEVYLRETPAEPLSTATKAILAIVSLIVGLLFLGALWRATTHHAPGTRIQKAKPLVKAALLRAPIAWPAPASSPGAGRAKAPPAAASGVA